MVDGWLALWGRMKGEDREREREKKEKKKMSNKAAFVGKTGAR